jgi:hypothetical protein
MSRSSLPSRQPRPVGLLQIPSTSPYCRYIGQVPAYYVARRFTSRPFVFAALLTVVLPSEADSKNKGGVAAGQAGAGL